MTKTLTKQWREGKLPEDTYYVRFICGRYGVYEFEQFKGFGFDNDVAYIKEVLAPVPSYEKWKQMIDGDKATIYHLKKILPMIEYNRVAYDYLKKVIEDMETDIKGVK